VAARRTAEYAVIYRTADADDNGDAAGATYSILRTPARLMPGVNPALLMHAGQYSVPRRVVAAAAAWRLVLK